MKPHMRTLKKIIWNYWSREFQTHFFKSSKFLR